MEQAGNIGSVGKYDVKFEKGQLVLEVDANVGASSAGIVVKVDAKQVLDAFAKLGGVEAEVAKLLEAALPVVEAVVPAAEAAAPSA